MIECYIGNCEHHICHTSGVAEDPFCSLDECEKSNEEMIDMIEMMQEQRKPQAYDFAAYWGKAVLQEFMTMCAVIFAFLGSVVLLSWWLA